MSFHVEKAEKLLSEIRVHQAGQEGPMYGALKADAAVAYALLAVEARLGEIADFLKNGTGNEPTS